MNALDTNVLIYACDGRDSVKQARALSMIEGLADAVLLWQVACEFLAAARKLEPQGFTPVSAWSRLDEFAGVMPLVPPSPGALPIARRLHLERRVSYWDALLMGACLDAGIKTLHSEDIPGCVIDSLSVVNPFA